MCECVRQCVRACMCACVCICERGEKDVGFALWLSVFELLVIVVVVFRLWCLSLVFSLILYSAPSISLCYRFALFIIIIISGGMGWGSVPAERAL